MTDNSLNTMLVTDELFSNGTRSELRHASVKTADLLEHLSMSTFWYRLISAWDVLTGKALTMRWS